MDIYGFLKKSQAYNAFKRDYERGRAAHAYIVCGRDGYAVNNLLLLFASMLLCGTGSRPCLTCADCGRVLSGAHPDCRSYPLKGDKIAVSDIDNLTEEAGYRPCEGETKVFLLRGGDTMNAASQNKLLKTLEEPFESVYILIGAANTESLLPTVKSRCRITETGLFPEKEIYGFLTECGCGESKAAALARISGGSIGKALDMMSNENYINMYNFILGLFNRLKTYDDILPCMKTINAYDNKGEILEIMQVYFHGEMEKAVYEGRKGDYGIKSLIYFTEKTAEAKKKLKQNCNAAAVFENLLCDIIAAGKEEVN